MGSPEHGVANLLKAGINELAKLCRMCGGDSVKNLNKASLRALTEELGKTADVAMAYEVDEKSER